MPRLACALKYRPQEDAAPRVVAQGRGYLAEKIVRLAESAGVPVKEDAALAQVLCALEPFREIPPELYEPVAVLLAAVWRAGRPQTGGAATEDALE